LKETKCPIHGLKEEVHSLTLLLFSFLDSPSSLADLEANLARTMNHLAQNAKDLEVHVAKRLVIIIVTYFYHQLIAVII